MSGPTETFREAVRLTDGGIETDLIFNHGIELPEFASFVLHESDEGESLMRAYFDDYVRIAADHGRGLVLEAATWRASRDWGRLLGYDEAALRRVNERAVQFLQDLRRASGADITVSGCVGPRGDAYKDMGPAGADEALQYHRPQVEVLAGAGADVVSALTLTNVNEAVGFVLAARACAIPAVVSFTVETDGRLPDGTALADAIAATDAATDRHAGYFMINCAHPDHFASVLDAPDEAITRIGGIRANASRKSHVELDESTELDDGNPSEFGEQLAGLNALHPHLRVLGGCCGTDARHIAAIADSLES